MPNVNILKLNDILQEKNENVPTRGKIKTIQISYKIIKKLKNKNISSSTIEKLIRTQGTIVSDRREVHRKIDGYDFYITYCRGKSGHYETVKVSFNRTEKLLDHQNALKATEKATQKISVMPKVKTITVKKPAVLKTVKPQVENVDFKKTIINAKSVKPTKKVNRDKLLNEDLKVIDFKKLEQ